MPLDRLDSACKQLNVAAARLQAGDSTAIREADQALAEVRRITVELQVAASADPGHSPIAFGGRLPALPTYSELAEAVLKNERRAKIAMCEGTVRLIEPLNLRTSAAAQRARQLATWAKDGRDLRDELDGFAAALEAFDSQITMSRVDAVDRLEKEKAG